MTEVPSEPVKAPAYDRLHLVPSNVRGELIECGTSVLRARYAVINVFHRAPAPCLNVAPQLEELVFARLIGRGDPRIDSGCQRLHRLAFRDVAPVAAPLRFSDEDWSAPLASSHPRTARRTCSDGWMPSRSHTVCRP